MVVAEFMWTEKNVAVLGKENMDIIFTEKSICLRKIPEASTVVVWKANYFKMELIDAFLGNQIRTIKFYFFL